MASDRVVAELIDESETSCAFCDRTGSYYNPIVVSPDRSTAICGLCIIKLSRDLDQLMTLNMLNPTDMTRQ